MATASLVYGRGRTPNSWRKTLLFWDEGTPIKKYLVVEIGAVSREKVPLPMDLLRGEKTQVDFAQSWQSSASTGVYTSLA